MGKEWSETVKVPLWESGRKTRVESGASRDRLPGPVSPPGASRPGKEELPHRPNREERHDQHVDPRDVDEGGSRQPKPGRPHERACLAEKRESEMQAGAGSKRERRDLQKHRDDVIKGRSRRSQPALVQMIHRHDSTDPASVQTETDGIVSVHPPPFAAGSGADD